MFAQSYTALANVDGLSNLSSVGGSFYFVCWRNAAGSAGRAECAAFVQVRNSALANLDGLANLSIVGGSLKLVSLTGG